jgi:phytoene synthase
VKADPTGALRLALWGGSRVHWDGHAPWRDTLLQSRRALLAAARSLWLLPEILPPVVRDDVALLHAFCRHLDDTVDESRGAAEAAAGLSRLAAEVAGTVPRRPLLAALLAGAPRMELPEGAMLALIEGMRGDLARVRIADDDELIRYCYRVSSSVALMLCAVLRIPGRAWPRAVDLGIALQLTNIVEGVGDDARRDRVYLPRARLGAAGASAEDVIAGSAGEAVARVVSGLVDLGDVYYASADEGARDIPWRYRHGVLVLSRVYGSIGWQARRRGLDPRTKQPRVHSAEKAFRLLQVAAVSLTPRMLGLTPPPAHDDRLHAPIAGWPGTRC